MGRYGEMYLLVLLHQLVDVVVLALLDLEDLHLSSQLEVVAQYLHLRLVLLLQLLHLVGGRVRVRVEGEGEG